MRPAGIYIYIILRPHIACGGDTVAVVLVVTCLFTLTVLCVCLDLMPAKVNECKAFVPFLSIYASVLVRAVTKTNVLYTAFPNLAKNWSCNLE